MYIRYDEIFKGGTFGTNDTFVYDTSEHRSFLDTYATFDKMRFEELFEVQFYEKDILVESSKYTMRLLESIMHRDDYRELYHGPSVVRLVKNNKKYKLYFNETLPSFETSDAKIWIKNGKLHRTSGPAKIKTNMNSRVEIWYNNGKFHRDDNLPAQLIYYIDSHSNESLQSSHFFKNGKKIKYIDHYEDTYQLKILDKNNNLHNEDGPAEIEYNSSGVETGLCSYYYKGKRHRLDGPAYICKDHSNVIWYHFYIDNKFIGSKSANTNVEPPEYKVSVNAYLRKKRNQSIRTRDWKLKKLLSLGD